MSAEIRKVRNTLFDCVVKEELALITPKESSCEVINIFNCSDVNGFLKRILYAFKPLNLIIDMINVSNLDSSAIGVFINVSSLMKRTGLGSLIFVNLNSNVRRVLEMLEVQRLFATYTTIDEALAGLQLSA